MPSRLAAALALGAGLAASPALAGCTLSDITIKGWSWRIDAGELKIVGDIVNGCAKPIRAELQVVTRDAAGNVVDAQEFFSVGQGIPSGASSAFEDIETWNSKSKTVELKIIDIDEV